MIIGENAVIENNVSLNNCTIGKNVHIKSGASIGQVPSLLYVTIKDGFGWHIGTSDSGHKKKPQTMRVIIGDNVQIGSNTTLGTHSLIGNRPKIEGVGEIQ